MPKPIKAAVVQTDAVPAPLTERLGWDLDIVTRCVESGAQLIMLPEVSNTGYEYDISNPAYVFDTIVNRLMAAEYRTKTKRLAFKKRAVKIPANLPQGAFHDLYIHSDRGPRTCRRHHP